MKLVVIGAPLSGKGTLSKLISKEMQIPHISMGDLLRKIANGKNKYSVYIKNAMKEGKLVNDDLVKVVLNDRLSKQDCSKGFVLDGYPRNIQQAKLLDEIVSIDKVIYSMVSEVTVVQRMNSRYVCSGCGLTYSMDTYNKNYCEKCKERLVKRSDDNEETLLARISEFNHTTMPVIEKYYDENKLVSIINEGDINDVFSELKEKLNI